MYILMISRGIPSKYHPQWGCFEKDQAEALAAYGHKVVVISVDARFKRHRGRIGLHRSSCNGVEYYNYVMIPGKLYKLIGYSNYWYTVKFRYVDKLYKQIVAEHGKPDIIYAQFVFNIATGVQLKQKYNIPLVGIEHLARFNNVTLPKESFAAGSFAYQNADGLITVSQSLAVSLKRHFAVESTVVHNMYGPEFGIDTDIDVNKNTPSPVVFVSTASLVYRKGFDMLIEAFAKVDLSQETWRLNIIGWGEEQQNLEKQIAKHGLQDNIHLLGKMGKTQIADELKKSHVFVLPSRNENFSVAVLEGLSMGLPVIATDCGGIRECIDEKNGLIVPVDDVDSMAAALRKILDSYSHYDRNAIAQDCKARFSPQAIAVQLTAVFERAID